MPPSFSGMYLLWAGWVCKVHELVAGFYRITCPGYDGEWMLSRETILWLLGRPGN